MSWLIPERFHDDACRRHGWWVLLVLTALLYLPGLGTLPLMDRDEPRFAHATVEMMQRGSWVVPYFNSDPAMSDAERIAAMSKGKGAMEVGYRFDKPPLTYWWMRLHYTLFGVNEMAARLHSVLSVWLVALVVFALGRRLASARAGLTAGVAWITTLQIMVHGRLCVADMPMVLFVAVSCWALMELLLFPIPDPPIVDEEPAMPLARFGRWHWVLYLSLGLGFLAKGPIAWLVPGLALVLWRFGFWRKPGEWRRLKLWPGFLITLAMVAAWGIPALVETQGMFWKVGMGEHVVKRGTTAFNGRFPIPGYYLVTAFASLFPWIAVLPQVWSKVREQWDAEKAFLVSWLAAPYVIFSLYATQLPHYVMPGFPAAMLLLVNVSDLRAAKRWHLLYTLVVILGSLAAAVVVCGIASRNLHLWDGWHPAFGNDLKLLCLTLLSAAGLLSFFMMGSVSLLPGARGGTARHPLSKAMHAWMLLALASMGGAGVWFASAQVRQLHPAAQLAAGALPLPAKVDLVGWQYQEPSLVHYFDHSWKFMSKIDAVSERMNRKGPRVVVLLRREWTLSKALREKVEGRGEFSTEKDFSKEVDALTAAHPDYQIWNFSGINPARTSWAELRMLIKKDLR